jgi:uncharacterized SAM-binding protein YcdF (DUF218 family)
MRTMRVRVVQATVLMLAAVLTARFLHPDLPGAVLAVPAIVLVSSDHLAPAQAIAVLDDGSPYGEIEAATLYRSGWAPVVLLVRRRNDVEALQVFREIGLDPEPRWDRRRRIVERLGVPTSAIIVPERAADGLEEELAIVRDRLRVGASSVILVAAPYQTRRARIEWSAISGDTTPAIIRPAASRFEATRWWTTQRDVLAVAREYVGLIQLVPDAPRLVFRAVAG